MLFLLPIVHKLSYLSIFVLADACSLPTLICSTNATIILHARSLCDTVACTIACYCFRSIFVIVGFLNLSILLYFGGCSGYASVLLFGICSILCLISIVIAYALTPLHPFSYTTTPIYYFQSSFLHLCTHLYLSKLDPSITFLLPYASLLFPKISK